MRRLLIGALIAVWPLGFAADFAVRAYAQAPAAPDVQQALIQRDFQTLAQDVSGVLASAKTAEAKLATSEAASKWLHECLLRPACVSWANSGHKP